MLDKAALLGLALGLTLYVMPFAPEGRMKWAFWLTLASTLLHVFTSHKVGSVAADPPAAPPAAEGGEA
jgi:hypothetical protein